MSNEKLPPVTQQPIITHFDGMPDEGYPLRILRAYRELCNLRWETNTSGAPPNSALCDAMNQMQEERARHLDKAIHILEMAVERG